MTDYWSKRMQPKLAGHSARIVVIGQGYVGELSGLHRLLRALSTLGSMIERVVEVAESFEDADESDRSYWWSQPPSSRLAHALWLRRLNYGDDRVSARLQRVLEVAQRERG